MPHSVLCLAFGVFALSAGASYAQTSTKEAVALSGVDTEAEVNKAVQAGISDHIVRLVDVGPYNVATAIVIRHPAHATAKAIGNVGGALSHDKITEVYYVLRGSGVQVTGGTLVNPKPQAGGGAVGPSLSGNGIDKGHSMTLRAGDSLIIPPGVPHMWSAIAAEGVDYIVFRIDPERVLNMK